MVYKKYIKRGGRTYGPYIYHSKRENGKVITEYRGKTNHNNFFKIFLYVFMGIFLFVGFYSFLTTFDLGITGRASLQLATDYKPNETLNGVLRLSLQQGELVPADSQVIVDMNGEIHNYNLDELISTQTIEGDFYVDNLNISGKGIGFGEKGTKKDSVEVNFELEVFDKEAEIIPVEEEAETPKTPTEETNTTSNEESIEKNATNENTETSNEETSIGESTTESGETSITGSNVINEETPTTGESTTTETTQETTETSGITSGITSQTTEENTATENSANEQAAATNSEAQSASETPSEPSGITGGFVRTITGFVSMDLVESVDGFVTYDSPFKYQLPEGKTASIKSGSVSINGQTVDDSYLSFSIQNGVALISTKYAGDETGFGSEYLNKEKVNFDIDLNRLNLTAKDGQMTIKIVYDNSVIVETSSELSVSLDELEKVSEAFSEEEFMNSSSYILTEEERNLLIRETGSDIVETKEANVVNDRLVIKYKLGVYWMEFSYDYPGSLTETLNKRIEFERKQWIKTLAQRLNKKESGEETISLEREEFPLNETGTIEEKTETNITVEKEITEENVTNENTLEETPNQNNTPIAEEKNITEVEGIEQNYSI